jgi:uncharacterized protein YwgA
MTTYDFVHLTFLALDGKIDGKTKLQKTVYLLGVATGREDELGYRAHFYGPYSDDVAAAVERLKTLGFLEQTVSGVGAFDSRGFEVARHDYRLNEAGKKMAEVKATRWPNEWIKLEGAVAVMRALLAQDYMKLSIAAKTWFLLRKKGHATMSDIQSLAPKFGWSVTADQIKEAAQLLKGANLVKLGAT